MYIDHFVWATADLFSEIIHFEAKMGLRPLFGGRHEGRGTHNALLYLGQRCYLELIAPDPGQAVKPWILGDRPSEGLIHWAWRTNRIEMDRAWCIETGWDLGPIQDGQRTLQNGHILQWSLTDPDQTAFPFQPFLIQWSPLIHPADSLKPDATLEQIEVSHTGEILNQFRRLIAGDFVYRIGDPGLVLTIRTAKGLFRLSSGTGELVQL